MLSSTLLKAFAAASAFASVCTALPGWPSWGGYGPGSKKIKPKVFIINMFDPEAEIWWGISEFNVLARNVTVTGFSPLFPDAHCTANGEICQMVTGESEINAAASVSALVLSGLFDLTQTYFLVAGIAGINPEVATLASVTFARYAVQVALEYEFDAREMPSNYSTGYIPLGADAPDSYPLNIYGTEVFEVNANLRELAMGFAKKAKLQDSAAAIAYRAKYAKNPLYAAGAKPPSVVACDSATSDVYYSGALLSEAFANYTTLITNGTGAYCATAQEDNATLEALVRAARAGLVDFARIVLMRTASDFDRPPPGESPEFNLFYAHQGGFVPSIANIHLAGVQVVLGIVKEWDHTFKKGIKATNYIGDIFDTLKSPYKPDFGPYTASNSPVASKRRRSLTKRGMSMPVAV